MTEHYLEVAIKAAETSGHILLDYFGRLHDFRQKNKNTRDLVTEVDILSENNIKEKIKEAFPSHSIKAEESGVEEGNTGVDTSRVWHIDGIDGTVNYSQGIPLCAISLALEENKEIIVGVTLNPFSEECFFASKGKGAYLNGRQIQVSKKIDMKDGVYIAAFSAATSRDKKKEYEVFGRVNDTTRGVLRIGSAALSLAYLACGKIDGFWSKNLFPWDLAAGLILVNEAGGEISSLTGGEYKFTDSVLVASNKLIHKDLLTALTDL